MACICGHKHGAASPLAAGKPDVPGHGRPVFAWCDCHVKAAGARCAPPTGAAAYHKPDLQGTVLTVPKHESIASFRLCAGNHPSVCVADSSPQRGAKHDLRQDIGSPGGELDAKRPEGWFLAANLKQSNPTPWNSHCARRHLALPQIPSRPIGQGLRTVKTVPYRTNYNGQHTLKQSVGRVTPPRRKLEIVHD